MHIPLKRRQHCPHSHDKSRSELTSTVRYSICHNKSSRSMLQFCIYAVRREHFRKLPRVKKGTGLTSHILMTL
jgi:hypothetical protein